MAKLKAPLYSQSAQGSLANLLEYSRRAGNNLIRLKQAPTDGNTALQQIERGYFALGAAAWRTLSNEEKALWHDFNIS